MSPSQPTPWEIFLGEAAAVGLNLCYVVRRPPIDAAFHKRIENQKHSPGRFIPPESHLPEYKSAILLGSGGREFWEAFQAAPEATDGRPDPLDRFAVRQVEGLGDKLRGQDPHLVTAYPFHHTRQIIPFLALIEHTGLSGPSPFGVSVHPQYGPWFAWRGLVLSQIDWPDTPMPTDNPCLSCAQDRAPPCLAACPAEAAQITGLVWEKCLTMRKQDTPCQRACAARAACVIAPEHQYGPLQTAHHAAASYREIKKMEL